MCTELSIEEFLGKKKDFSPFLVHLTKDEVLDSQYILPAKYTLEMILDEKALRALNHFCYFSVALNAESSSDIQKKFKVVCFTETPIDQIDVLLNRVTGRNFKPEPYGLVFKKEYIREKKGGNPVLYITKEIARPLFTYLYNQHVQGKEHAPAEICKLLALVNVCERGNDWHWEREWRIVGSLEFKLKDIYCGLCPENDISYFEDKYPQVKFISPIWKYNKILAKGIGR